VPILGEEAGVWELTEALSAHARGRSRSMGIDGGSQCPYSGVKLVFGN